MVVVMLARFCFVGRALVLGVDLDGLLGWRCSLGLAGCWCCDFD